MLFTNRTCFAGIRTNAQWSQVWILLIIKLLIRIFIFFRSNLQRWQELADEKQQLTRTNLSAITAGTSTDDISDSSRTPPANNTRQPASSWYAFFLSQSVFLFATKQIKYLKKFCLCVFYSLSRCFCVYFLPYFFFFFFYTHKTMMI